MLVAAAELLFYKYTCVSYCFVPFMLISMEKGGEGGGG